MRFAGGSSAPPTHTHMTYTHTYTGETCTSFSIARSVRETAGRRNTDSPTTPSPTPPPPGRSPREPLLLLRARPERRSLLVHLLTYYLPSQTYTHTRQSPVVPQQPDSRAHPREEESHSAEIEPGRRRVIVLRRDGPGAGRGTANSSPSRIPGSLHFSLTPPPPQPSRSSPGCTSRCWKG